MSKKKVVRFKGVAVVAYPARGRGLCTPQKCKKNMSDLCQILPVNIVGMVILLCLINFGIPEKNFFWSGFVSYENFFLDIEKNGWSKK